MKLLIYSHYFAPSVGGVETIVRSLADGLAELDDAKGRREFEVTVATQTAAPAAGDQAFAFRVVRQPRTAALWHLIRESDAVHLAGPALLPMVLAALARKPFAVEHHGYQAICLNGLLVHQPDGAICPGHFQAHRYRECLRCESAATGRNGLRTLMLTILRNRLVRRANANIAVSGHVDQRVVLPNSQIIYHGIAAAALAPEPAAPSHVCFAYVGRFVPEKGIEVLLNAAAAVRKQRSDFTVKLIGDGPERQKLEERIVRDDLQDAVTITGFLAGSALQEALRDVFVVVMPSVWEETAGLSAMEQMMRGRLVIASHVGGLSEVLGDAGLTFALGSSEELSCRMLEVLNQPSLMDSYGRKASLRAQQLFQRSRMIAEHSAFYRRLVR